MIYRRRIACALLGLSGWLAWRAADRPMWPVVERSGSLIVAADADVRSVPYAGPIGAPLAQLPLPPVVHDGAAHGVRLEIDPLPAMTVTNRLPSAAITYVEAAPSADMAMDRGSSQADRQSPASGWQSEGAVLKVGYEAASPAPTWGSPTSPVSAAMFDLQPTRNR